MDTIHRKHKGALAELRATAWLLNQGYEVFRNVSAHGPVDLVALNPETLETELFDVKMIYTGRYGDNLLKRPSTAVKILTYDPSTDVCKVN